VALLAALACSAHAREGPSRRLLRSAWALDDPLKICATIIDPKSFKLIQPGDIKMTKPEPETSLNGLGAIELSSRELAGPLLALFTYTFAPLSRANA
jgi:hypothetical protein